ncbi:MAG: C-GCAxxG-C-C family (seleno)protein [Bacillota bacterium]
MLEMQASRIAREAMEKGFNCCEAVLMAANEVLKLNLPPVMLASGALFAKGMGSGGGSCGALIGLTMGSGILSGRHPHPLKKKLASHLYGRFSEKFSSSCCGEILKNRSFWARPGEKGCNSLVETTAAMMMETWEEILRGNDQNICDYTNAQ